MPFLPWLPPVHREPKHDAVPDRPHVDPGHALPGPVGGPKDLAYAAHYADGAHELTMPDLIAAFVRAPKTMERPEKPEGAAETHPFGFGNFTDFFKTRPDPAEWQDPTREARSRTREEHKAPTEAKAAPAAGKWKAKIGDGGVTGGYSEHKNEGGVQHQTGVGADTRGNLSVGHRAADDVDDKGKVVSGASASASVGRDGLNAGMSRTKDGMTTSMGVQINPITGEQAAKISHGDEHKNASVSVSTKDGTTAITASGKYGPVSGKASYSETDRIKRGEIGEEGIDATIRDFVGAGTYVEHDTGHSVSGGADVEYSIFGAGGSGYKGTMDKRRHFQARKADEAPKRPMLPGVPGMGPSELEGFHGIADVDIAKLKPGEGYSIEQNKQKGGEGHIKAGITVGLGKDDADMAQTVLARDAHGDIRVMVAQGDEQSLTGSVSAAGAVSLSGKETNAKSASVSFTAHGPEGEKAVKEFQQTGLLPGADKVAKLADPDVTAKYDAAKKEWQEAVKVAKDLTGYPAMILKQRIDQLREKMCEAAGPVNDAFLQHRGGALADVAGVSYDDHTTAHQTAHDTSLGLLGFDILLGGSEETEWEKGYRAGGKAQLAQGYERKDKYLIAATETSDIVMNPKGYSKDGDAVAMVMGGKQRVNQRQRDILAKAGPEAFDMPPETLEAWRNGSMNEAELANIAVTMTEGQLAKIRDTIARPDLVHTSMIAGGASGLYEQVRSGGKVETQAKAMMGGDADARLAVERNKELNQLYQDAAAARVKQVLQTGKFDYSLLADGGMKDMLAHVDHVKTAEDFVKLTPEEQKLVIATGAIAMRGTGQNSFECMRLVLQVKDKDQRNNLMRQLFETNERREKGADSAVDFVQWVETQGDVSHVPKEEMKQLLSGVAVRSDDSDTKSASATHDYYELLHPGLGNEIIGKRLAEKPDARQFDKNMGEHMRQRPEERDADRITDLLQAARGDKANPQAVQAAVTAAMTQNPYFLGEMWNTLEKDPARLAWANYMLQGTIYHRDLSHK